MGGAGQELGISPGIGGFIAFFLLAVALWLLMRNMLGHLRTVRYNEDQEDERRDAEKGEDVSTRPRRRQLFLPQETEPAPEPDAGGAPAATGGTDTEPARETASDRVEQAGADEQHVRDAEARARRPQGSAEPTAPADRGGRA